MSLNKQVNKSIQQQMRKASQGPPQGYSQQQQNEATRLRQQLMHHQSLVRDLKEELKEQNQLYLDAIKQRDAGAEKLKNAKESMGRFDALVQAQVDRAMAAERKEKDQLERKLEERENEIEMLKQAKDHQDQKVEELQDQLNQYAARDGNQGKAIFKDEKAYKVELDKKKKEIEKLTKHMNYLQDQIEDFMAENKQLRDLSAVPDNFGIDREKVRLLDREKIDDYKKLVRILQEDNYLLEKERANLKHKIKEMSMLINNKNPVERYDQFNLKPEQWAQLDQYVLKLKNDEVIEPADIYDIKMQNELLKAQIEIYKDKDVDKVREQMEHVLKELTAEGEDGQKRFGGASISPDQLKQITQGYDDIKAQLAKIAEQGIAMVKPDDPGSQSFRMNQTGSVGGQTSMQIVPSHLQPPRPTQNPDGTIHSGYSFRFDAHMPVTGRQGERDEKQEYDNAFLQLQLMECFAKIDKQDEIMKAQKRDVELLYQRIQKYVLLQDHLYRDYAKLEKTHEELNKRAAQKAMDAEEELQVERSQVKQLNALVNQLQGQSSGDANRKQVIELTKQNTILEVNMIQATRKYQNLEEKEKLLRRNYETVDAQMSEMQVECQERINELKKWKSNAVYQMKGLYERLKTSYPEAEYQSLEDELKLLRNKYADQINQIQDMTSQLVEFKKNQRLVSEQADKQKELLEYNQDLEKEYNYLTSRLVRIDPKFRYQQNLIKRIVKKLKNSNVSIVKAFQKFDTDKDGYINPSEMAQALEDIGMEELSNRDIQMLIDQMDKNKNGLIEHKEFSFMLQREGLKSRSLEESMVFNIIKTMKSLKRQKSYIFELIDKKGQGYITKQDFKEFLNQLKSEHISDSDIESFINYFFKHESGGDITLNTFLSKFNMFEKKMQEEESQEQPERKKRRPIGEDTLRNKKKFFDELKRAIMDLDGATLRILFNKIDTDDSGDLDEKEFKLMFQKMQIQFKGDEVYDIFQTMDVDQSGRVEYAEFQADFNNITSKPFHQLWEEELASRQLHEVVEDDEMEGFGINYSGGIGGAGMSEQLRADLERKISSLDSKLKIAQMEINKEKEMKDITNQTLVLTQKRYDDLLKQFTQSKEEIFNYEMQIKQLKDLLNNSISKEQSQKIQQENDAIKTKLRETKSEMLSYKNMHNVVCEQVKSLKMLIERRKDENESLHQSVREMASESMDKSMLDKLRYVVMLSRWQEAAVNKKYSMKINEMNLLRTQLIEKDEEIYALEQDKEKHNADIQQYVDSGQNLRKQLARSKILFLPLSKAESFEHDIKKLVHERDQIELKYMDLRSTYNQVKLVRDNLQVQAETWREYKTKLENASKPQLNSEITKMIEKIQDMRIKTLQAESKASEMTEKNQYLEKMLEIKKKEINQLNEECAKIEKTMAVREQNWREQDSQRIKKFFAAKLKEEDQQRAIAQRRGARPPMPDMSAAQPVPTFGDDENRPKTAAETFKDAEISRLQDACAKLQDRVNELQSQNALLDTFSEQNQKIFGNQAAQMKQNIDQYAHQFHQVSQNEKEEILEAAQETIRTLNEMLEHKKQQLQTKERQIEKLRDQILDEKQKNADKVRALQNDLYDKGSSTLAKLHDFVDKQASGGERPGLLDERQRFKQQSDAAHLELKKANKGLEELKEINRQLQGDIETERARILSERAAHDGEIRDLKQEIERQKTQIHLEQNKRKELAKQRLQKNDDMYRKFEAKMLEQEKMILKLKDQNETWKLKEKAEKSLTAAEKASYGVAVGANKDAAVTKLQEEIQKRDQKIVDLNTKIQKNKTSKEQIQTDIEKAQKELKKVQEDKSRLQMDKVRQEETITKLNSELRNLRTQAYELREDNKRHMSEKEGIGKGGGMSYKQLEIKLSEANEENFILRKQKETVVAVNPKSQAFEYIGNPLPLKQEQELETIDQILDEITKWNQRPGNELISVGQIFQAVDTYSYEELSEEEFKHAMAKCGIKLRENELYLLKKHLIKDELGQLKYMTLVRALSGIPQQDFMNKSINKLAQVAETRNMSKTDFRSLVDPDKRGSLTLDQLQAVFKNAKAQDFKFDDTEVRSIFFHVTGTKNPAGVRLDVQNLIDQVFESSKALVLEQIRKTLIKKDVNLNKLYQNYDKNRDDIMDAKEFEKAMEDLGLLIPTNVAQFLYGEVFDPMATKLRRSVKITKKVLRKYVECYGNMGSKLVKVKDKQQDIQFPSDSELAKKSVGREISQEEEARSKITCRKILSKLHQSLIEVLGKLDHIQDGILLRSELHQALLDSKVPDLTSDEVSNLLGLQDRGQRGYISMTKFIDIIYEYATETESDQILRRLANAAANNLNVNLRESLDLHDLEGNGLLEKADLKRSLKNCHIPVSDNELEIIYKEIGGKIAPKDDNDDRQISDRQTSRLGDQDGGSRLGGVASKIRPDARAKTQPLKPVLEIRKFLARIELIGKSKPLPQYIFNQKGGKGAQGKQGASQSMMKAHDDESKYKKNLDLLRTEIEEKNREIDAKDKEIRECKTKISFQDREKKKLETQLMNKDQKPPKETRDESKAFDQAQELIQVKDQLYYQQEENIKLKKSMKVTLKAEITKISTEKDQLDEKLKDKNDEIARLNNTIQRLFARPMDSIEKREEMELQKQFKINELEEIIATLEKDKLNLQEELYKANETNLSLKFEKETYDLQYARLQKRIKDLDQYKESTSGLSAKLAQQEQEDLEEIDEQVGKSESLKKRKDTNKFRKRPMQNVAELELLVDSLKRVIEKLKTENEHLKKENAKYSGVGEKQNVEKSLRTKISNLETVIQSHEMKDVNLDEQKRTIKKLIDANKQLRSDLEKEVDRYTLLENKYRDVLAKFNSLDKANSKNEEMIFGMTTGTNIRKYQNYMLDDENE